MARWASMILIITDCEQMQTIFTSPHGLPPLQRAYPIYGSPEGYEKACLTYEPACPARGCSLTPQAGLFLPGLDFTPAGHSVRKRKDPTTDDDGSETRRAPGGGGPYGPSAAAHTLWEIGERAWLVKMSWN